MAQEQSTEQVFLSKMKFGKLIEGVVRSHKSSYMDAVIHLCEQHDVELEEVRKFISPIIRDKIEAEARGLNFLPRQNTLPVV